MPQIREMAKAIKSLLFTTSSPILSAETFAGIETEFKTGGAKSGSNYEIYLSGYWITSDLSRLFRLKTAFPIFCSLDKVFRSDNRKHLFQYNFISIQTVLSEFHTGCLNLQLDIQSLAYGFIQKCGRLSEQFFSRLFLQPVFSLFFPDEQQ